MAREPIDTSSRPSMRSVACAGDCGEWIVIDSGFTGDGYCSKCLTLRVGLAAAGTTVEPPPQWFARNNPPPPFAVYPPGAPIAGIRVADPDVAGYCLAHDPPVSIHLMTLDPYDISLAYRMHDIMFHQPTRWLIGGPGGADGDVCNPCGGGDRDKNPLITVIDGKEFKGPRHDLCLRGNRRGGWGRNCPCQHDRPWMRGIKPDTPDRPVKPTPKPPASKPVVSEPPVIITGYLFDPEEEDPDA